MSTKYVHSIVLAYFVEAVNLITVEYWALLNANDAQILILCFLQLFPLVSQQACF